MSKRSAIASWVSESGPRSVDELFSGVRLGRARLVQDGVAVPLHRGSSIDLRPGLDVVVVAEIHSVFPVTDVIGQVVRVDDAAMVTDGFCEAASPDHVGLLEVVIDGSHIRGGASLMLQVGLMRSRMTDEIGFRIGVT